MSIPKEKLDRLASAAARSAQGSVAEDRQGNDQQFQLMLPLWPAQVRAVPNGFLRSALFGVVGRGPRRNLKGEQIASVEGIKIVYTGERLDQSDLDVWGQVVQAVRDQALGDQAVVSSYQLLASLGLTDTGKNRQTLHKRIMRLAATALEVRIGTRMIFGPLIAGGGKDEKTGQWLLRLDPKLRPLFEADQYTQLDWRVRRELSGQPLAQWLHGFYASHAEPFRMKVETLYKLCGSETGRVTDFQKNLVKSFDSLARASEKNGVAFSYEVADGVVSVSKSPTSSQRKHIAAKRAAPTVRAARLARTRKPSSIE